MSNDIPQSNDVKPQVLKRAAVAARLGIAVGTLDTMRKRGDGPRAMIHGPRNIRYAVTDVEEYENSIKQGGKV